MYSKQNSIIILNLFVMLDRIVQFISKNNSEEFDCDNYLFYVLLTICFFQTYHFIQQLHLSKEKSILHHKKIMFQEWNAQYIDGLLLKFIKSSWAKFKAHAI